MQLLGLSAAAPVFGLMLAGRVLAAFAHGAFFGIGSVVAADLVAPDRRARAIATMFTGLTVANVVGVPVGTWLGQSVGWRATFYGVAGLGVLGLTGIAALIPDRPGPAVGPVRQELAALRDTQVWLAMAMTVLGFGGVFAAITYLTPMMTGPGGFADSSVTWLLVLFGIGLVAGNLLGGRFADRSLMRLLYVTLAGLAAILALFTVTAQHKPLAVVTVVLIGMFGFASVPPLQKRVMDQAAAAPNVASAGNIAAFNLGNALAAWLGGLVIDAGHGYTAPNLVGAAMAATALGLALLSAALERRATGGQVRPAVPTGTPTTPERTSVRG